MLHSKVFFFFWGNFQLWEEQSDVSKGGRRVRERDSLWRLEFTETSGYADGERKKGKWRGIKESKAAGKFHLSNFFLQYREEVISACGESIWHECDMSSHQMQDMFEFLVWSRYFDILLGARQYSLCLAPVSSAAQRFLLQEWTSKRVVVCLIWRLRLSLWRVII